MIIKIYLDETTTYKDAKEIADDIHKILNDNGITNSVDVNAD